MNESKNKWVSAWANAMSITDQTPASYGKNITFRYPVLIPFDGDKVRITLDNFCGMESITLSKATVFDGTDFYPVTFHGSPSVTMAAEQCATCDEISLSVHRGQTRQISLYFGEVVQLRSGVVITGPLSKGKYAFGEYVNEETLPVENTRNTSTVYFLSDVSVFTEQKNHAVVCYGDSITAQSWPDYLLQRAMSEDNNFSVVRKAASGTRILRQYSCATYLSYGLCGKVRFPHEIPSLSGADTIIIQQGINDIIHPVGVDVNVFRPWSDLPTVEELCQGLENYVSLSRRYKIKKVYVGTLLPIEGWRTYSSLREEMKEGVNEYIRSMTTIDGVIDFDRCVRDEQDPKKFALGFDSGDHLHPSEQAYSQMAACAYLQLKK